ncbi:MAG: hydroxymethylbilane synthase [Flavobacteriaceae bacterium]
MDKDPIRIGTRSSPLALWQAQWVATLLKSIQIPSELVFIDSAGDQDGTQPLYAMNIQGIFTKALDQALLNKDIDIAVHSFKDVPTQLPENIELGTVLERGSTTDILVYNSPPEQWTETEIVGTSSLRRSAQWKNRYPKHRSEILRGNVQKRLQTLSEKKWLGALFAQAGLERVNQLPPNHLALNWMLPAPAQGAVCVVMRNEEPELQLKLKSLGCETTFKATDQERIFLRLLEGGCTAPIGACIEPVPNGWFFRGGVFALDGSEKVTFEKYFPSKEWQTIGERAAEYVLQNGGESLMKAFKKS